MTRGALVIACGAGLLWWGAVLRLVLAPAEAGVLEGTVVVGGWSLSLLPVHCASKDRADGVAAWTRSGRRRADGL